MSRQLPRSIAAAPILALVLVAASRLQAGGPVSPLPMPTMGGKQFWADELFFHERRIQQNVNFVAHSLGNIVVRRYLGDQTDAATYRSPDRRIKRFVMLAPPNHGSLLAVTLGDNKVYQVVTGQTGQQLGRDWQRVEGKLATPACEFGILAGGRGDTHGYNLLLPGDNDGIINVDTTRLAGAADFRLVPAQHSVIMFNAKVQEFTLRFLQKGFFISEKARTRG